jgi:hypothetical protein
MKVLSLITNIDELNKYLTTKEKLNTIKIDGKDTELLNAIEKVNELLNECISNNTCESTFFDNNKEMYDFNLKPIYKLYNYIGIDDSTAKTVLECTIGRNILDYTMFYELFTKVIEKLIQANQSNNELDLHLNNYSQLYTSKKISNTTMFNLVNDLIHSTYCISTDLYITDKYDNAESKNQLQGITITIKSVFSNFMCQQFVDYTYNLVYDKTEDIAVLNIRDSYKGNKEVNVKITTRNFLSQFKELQKIVIDRQQNILKVCLGSNEKTIDYLKEIFG